MGTVTGATVWHLWEMKNYNFTAHTFDLWLDGVSFATGIAMTASGFNAVGLENTDTTVGHDVYYDNAIVRNYVSLEPILGPWGARGEPSIRRREIDRNRQQDGGAGDDLMQYIDQIIATVIALAFGVIWAVKGGQFPQDVTLIAVTWLFRGGVPKTG